jgi:hypothetical protein
VTPDIDGLMDRLCWNEAIRHAHLETKQKATVNQEPDENLSTDIFKSSLIEVIRTII